MCTECHMDTCMLQPCGLDYQQLGPYHYACSVHNYVCNHSASSRIMSCLAPLLSAWERMVAKYPPATNGDLNREKSAPESTRIMQDGSHLDKAIEVAESRVLGWAARFSMVQ